MAFRTYLWTDSEGAIPPVARGARPLKPVLTICFVIAVLLTAVLWLVPSLPHRGYNALGNQTDVALTFLSAAGLPMLLALVWLFQIKRKPKSRGKAILVYSIMGLVIGLLLAFMLLLVQLVLTDALYSLSPTSPAESAYLFIGAVALSLVLLLKIVLKLDQLKRVPNA